ncbi:MAG: FeoB-associated Cys-rich membrane protein [Candidatus Hydrogenedentes bacterium]|nr:FeoB-associated Cys-rich membrane protein [Candidatus Hydrogenedentota bacterium]
MAIEWVVVGAFLLYAVIYLGRYLYRMLKGKKTGCGCGDGGACKK